MLRTVRSVVGLTAVVTMAFVVRAHVAGAAPVATPAPAVEWHDAAGAVVRMADTKGHIVLIDFWASWCPPCKESFPALDVLQRDYRARGVQVIAVNVGDRREDADAFLAAHPHQLLVVFDPRGESPKAFKVRGMPTSFVIDRLGAIRYMHQGYNPAVDAAYRRELDTLIAETAR
jgi:thiol-disulfide isomerase/thioredoxin